EPAGLRTLSRDGQRGSVRSGTARLQGFLVRDRGRPLRPEQRIREDVEWRVLPEGERLRGAKRAIGLGQRPFHLAPVDAAIPRRRRAVGTATWRLRQVHDLRAPGRTAGTD